MKFKSALMALAVFGAFGASQANATGFVVNGPDSGSLVNAVGQSFDTTFYLSSASTMATPNVYSGFEGWDSITFKDIYTSKGFSYSFIDTATMTTASIFRGIASASWDSVVNGVKYTYNLSSFRVNSDVLDDLGTIAKAGDYGVNVGVSVAAVPEPQTYAMLLAGLGMVGLMARRRSR